VAAPAGGASDAVPRGVVVRDVRAGFDRMAPHRYEQRDTTVEPSIAVNPKNLHSVVAVYQEGRVDAGGDEDNGYAVTFDAGKTWRFGELPGLTRAVHGPWDRASDAVVAFGPDGTAYASSLVVDEGTNPDPSGIAVN